MKNKLDKSCPICTSNTFKEEDVAAAVQYLRDKIQENEGDETVIGDYWELIDDAFPDLSTSQSEGTELPLKDKPCSCYEGYHSECPKCKEHTNLDDGCVCIKQGSSLN